MSQLESLKITDEEISKVFEIDTMSPQDLELLKNTVFELSKLLYQLKEDEI